MHGKTRVGSPFTEVNTNGIGRTPSSEDTATGPLQNEID